MHKKSAIKRVANERKSAIKRVIMYKRKIENVLQSWLDDASHKPLVVKGVRQCGKTSSVMDFAQKHFKHVVYGDGRPKRWQEWERKYSGLTTAQYIFLIMQDDLRFDDEAIAAALAVKRTSVRSMRSRIKGRER